MLLIPKLDHHSPVPQYAQLYEYLKQEITSGRLTEKTRLPSVRKLADFLSISTTPIETAYTQLLAEGFIESRQRSGYFVQKLPESYSRIEHGQVQAAGSAPVPLQTDQAYRYDFHLSKNDFTLFPFQLWRRLANQVLRPERQELLFYGDPQGEAGLRREIATYLHQFRGVRCSPEQIVLGASEHQLVSLLCLMCKHHTDSIGVENPGYPLLPATFRQHGYRIAPIALEQDGISISELYESGVKLVWVSPSHQFTQGTLLPVSKRLQLLEWAKSVDGYIIEDDYEGEFRYHGRPIPSLQGLLPNRHVIYVGGFSHVLAPAICIHYMVLPEPLLPVYRGLYSEMLFEQSASRLHQITLQRFMEQGHFARHVRKMRNLYRKKHDLLVHALQTNFQGKAVIKGKDAGLHVLLRLESTKTEAELLQLAKNAGIHIASAAYTWLSPPPTKQKAFFIGFGGIALEQIEEGIKLLHDVWADVPF